MVTYVLFLKPMSTESIVTKIVLIESDDVIIESSKKEEISYV